MDKLRIFNVKWTSTSAGPSLDNNKRTEIFLAGCKKAEEGHPCKGCFNQELWKHNHFMHECTPEEAYEQIKKFAPNKYITFVGGEPLDQADLLLDLCKLLKADDYHIIIITHYTAEEILESNHILYWKLVNYTDVLIDGEYNESQRIWDEDKAGDGLHDVIGSGNQCIYDFHRGRKEGGVEGTYAGDLVGMAMKRNEDLIFIVKDKKEVAERSVAV